MCTAICYRCKDGYFGRNLDLEFRYSEEIIITPRNFIFNYNHVKAPEHHYAFIGIGSMHESYPLYYDGANEHGLCIASLNFVDGCALHSSIPGKLNLATYEIIPYILSLCKTVDEAEEILASVNLTDESISCKMPAAHLHFMLSDKSRSITAEPKHDGMKIYNNPYEILTNDPDFNIQMQNLYYYLNSNTDNLPGGIDSKSRFIRAAVTNRESVKKCSEIQAVSQFFHILSEVYHIEGVPGEKNPNKRTQYSSCISLESLTYYVRTYTNSRICALALSSKSFFANELERHPIIWEEDIKRL